MKELRVTTRDQLLEVTRSSRWPGPHLMPATIQPPRGGSLAGLPAVAWASCARCSGDLFIEPQTLPRSSGLPGDGPWVYCKTCRPLVEREQAARPCVKGARCVHVDYPRGPFADMIVQAVDGDRVKTGVLGFPDGVPEGAWLFHHTIGRGWYGRGELTMKGL